MTKPTLFAAQHAVNTARAKLHFHMRDLAKYTALAMRAAADEAKSEEELHERECELEDVRRGTQS